MVRLGIGQIEPKIGEPEKNISSLRSILREAESKQVEILVLPELANSGYSFSSRDEAFAYSEIIPDGPYSQEILSWSGKGRLVVVGICERHGERLYNSAGIFGDGKHLATYRKIHLFNKEKDWFDQGNEEPPVIMYQDHKFGIMICWDWIFPEITRILALKGSHAILHPSNLVLEYCQNAMRTRSLENGVFSATANRIGIERDLSFSGKSQIVDTKGNILVSIPDGVIQVDYVDLDLTEAEDKMLTPRNHLLNDRRPELYGKLTQNF